MSNGPFTSGSNVGDFRPRLNPDWHFVDWMDTVANRGLVDNVLASSQQQGNPTPLQALFQGPPAMPTQQGPPMPAQGTPGGPGAFVGPRRPPMPELLPMPQQVGQQGPPLTAAQQYGPPDMEEAPLPPMTPISQLPLVNLPRYQSPLSALPSVGGSMTPGSMPTPTRPQPPLPTYTGQGAGVNQVSVATPHDRPPMIPVGTNYIGPNSAAPVVYSTPMAQGMPMPSNNSGGAMIQRIIEGPQTPIDHLRANMMALGQSPSSLNAEQAAQTIGNMNQTQLGQGSLNLQTMQALGTNGIPGSMQTRAQEVAQMGRAADLTHGPDAQNAAAFNQFVQARIAAGGSMQDAMRDWTDSGMRLPVFAGGNPLSPSSFASNPVQTTGNGQGTVQTSPGGPPMANVQTNPGGNNPSVPLPGESLSSRFGRFLRGRGPNFQLPTTDTARMHQLLADFVGGLPTDMVNNNVHELIPLLRERFPNFNDFMQTTFSALGRTTPRERAVQILNEAINRRRPGTVTRGFNWLAPWLFGNQQNNPLPLDIDRLLQPQTTPPLPQ